MRHTDHGGVARFNADVERAYAARGWERCDPPSNEPSDGTPTAKQVSVSVTAPDVGKTYTPAMKRATNESRRRGGDTAQED